ncbi:Sodium/calcium exchanger protein-domain-containing protein [Pilobolus umbonatus]|nr:Sodium/calcium exchanger protein-domain-containing protein [Pilobolus umbonatus]
MKSNLSRVYYFLGCTLLILLIGISFTMRQTSLRSLYHPNLDTLNEGDCIDIHLQVDQCGYVQSHCDGFSLFYLELYYCSGLWKPLSTVILLSGLLILFGAISVVASDFFCPNLQTISKKLQLSESMAGVTVLALGNGSPDLFSTFTAMESNAGSLAIGELIGAAFFIVAIVSGCMGIIKPFKSEAITFRRDGTYLAGAVMIIMWIIYQQRIEWYHSILLICYYFSYVFVVAFGVYHKPSIKTDQKLSTENTYDETSCLISRGGIKPPKLNIPVRGFSIHSNISDYTQQHTGRPTRPLSANSSRPSVYFEAIPRSPSTSGSISTRLYRPPMTPRKGIRTSVFGAIEFQDQVNSMMRENRSYSISPNGRRRQTSMPPPTWQIDGYPFQLPHYYNRSDNGIQDKKGRQRASTMTDQVLLTGSNYLQPKSPENSGSGSDYFTYLSIHQSPIHDQPSIHIDSAPGSSLSMSRQTSEMNIPEIRLTMTLGSNELFPPTPIDGWTTPKNHSRNHTRGHSNNSLVPPSLYSEAESFYSAQQNFDRISPSHSFETHLTVQANMADDLSQRPVFHEPGTEYTNCSSPHSLWRTTLNELNESFFSTLQNWEEKTLLAKFSAILAVPLMVIFTTTLPVADTESVQIEDEVLEDEPHLTKKYLSVPNFENEIVSDKLSLHNMEAGNGWNKNLLAIQCITSTAFICSVFAANEIISFPVIYVFMVIGIALSLFVIKKTKKDEPPSWFWLVSFIGFFVALNWIFLLANEVVGLLQALGLIYGISEGIMGLTVFALGNSIGDFVSNTSIAKMGFPTMAISACYAGPLLNMVLGVGVSSFYQTWKSGKSYPIVIAPTIVISSIGLILVLLSTLILVNMNGYRITKQLGWWMIGIYMICLAINISIEFGFIQL